MDQELSRQQETTDHQQPRSPSPGSMPRHEHVWPPAISSRGQPSAPEDPSHPHEMAYLAALTQLGIPHPQAHQPGLLPPSHGRPTDQLTLSGKDEQELATLHLAEQLQQRQMPAVRSQPPTPHSAALFHDPLSVKMTRFPDPSEEARRAPSLLQESHGEGQPLGKQRSLPEDRFPHNPALDPFLSSLQQQQHFVAGNRASAPRGPSRRALPGFDALGFNEALRMRMDSPLYASNQAAAAAMDAAASAAAAAAAHMQGRGPYPPPLPQGFAPGSKRGTTDFPSRLAQDERSSRQGFAEPGQADRMHHHPQELWQDLSGASKVYPRGPAEAAMQAALRAQLMQGMPSDNGLQPAMQAVATHAEGELNQKVHMLGQESRRGLTAGRPTPFGGVQLPHPLGLMGYTQHSQPQACGTGTPADATLQLGRSSHEGADLDTPLPAEHPIESFIERERSRAGIGRGSSEQLELDRLHRAAERMGSQRHFIRGAETRAGQEAFCDVVATRGSISHPPMLPEVYPPVSLAGEFNPHLCLLLWRSEHEPNAFAVQALKLWNWPNFSGHICARLHIAKMTPAYHQHWLQTAIHSVMICQLLACLQSKQAHGLL